MELVVIDCEFQLRPRSACAYVLPNNSSSEGEYCIVECNTNLAIPMIMRSLSEHGIAPASVKYLALTHVHLDHSGGAGELMKLLPNAVLLCHASAKRHLVNPTQLVASAKQVWGEELFAKLYGDVAPVPASRIKVCADGERLAWGVGGGAQDDDYLEFFYTRGHANHHMCVYDSRTRGVFTGDAFGAMYPDLQDFDTPTIPGSKRMHIHPITTPTQFDADEAQASVRRILAYHPVNIYLTHFGVLHGQEVIAEAAGQLLAQLDYCRTLVSFVADLASEEEMHFVCEAMLRRYFADKLLRGLRNSKLAWATILDGEVRLNAQGLTHAALKLRRENGGSML